MSTPGIVEVSAYWGRVGLAVAALLCPALLEPLFGQAQPTILAVGYKFAPVVVSPGQIVTLFVAGLIGVEEAHADKVPLPTELAGFRVLVNTPESLMPAPILAVETFNPMSWLAAVTVQIPYEIVAVSSPQLPTGTRLLVIKDGRESADIWAYTVELAPRVARRCEYNSYHYGFDCTPMITHSDGSLVTREHPAGPGEVLVVYALGLGRTIPPTPTGAAPAEPRPIENIVRLDADFTPNAAPREMGYASAFRPLYVGAVQGFVGLYQINLRVPPIPPGTPPCSDAARTNLTLTLASKTYDGAGICVQP